MTDPLILIQDILNRDSLKISAIINVLLDRGAMTREEFNSKLDIQSIKLQQIKGQGVNGENVKRDTERAKI